ncbi:folate family ECF transporter S component [Ruminococcus sp. NK3A76]|uniref:folate family ECF transporter S component n=1 Tax=Ruminococcus sp. NK3A76 TaxID=877411 RepID=UPI00068FA5B1|nr:folate family ECF transporter S component [Ruminococcus sp. NK3A76]
MKNFFKMFADSAKEFKSVKTITVTGMFIALSMIIEMFSIDIGYAKLNFAFIAIAVIGMLFGPTVGFGAGLVCDVVGYIAHPTGAFLPMYTLVAGLQGLIYGICLYYKRETPMEVKGKDISLFVKATVARLLDVIIINLLINTKLNMHYGFIPAAAYSTAIKARVLKNLIELAADLPLLFILLPICLAAYKRTSKSSAKAS